MAFSVMGGLFVATALTLVLLPNSLCHLFDRGGADAVPAPDRVATPAEEATR